MKNVVNTVASSVGKGLVHCLHHRRLQQPARDDRFELVTRKSRWQLQRREVDDGRRL